MPYVTETGSVVRRPRHDVALSIDSNSSTIWLDFAAIPLSAMRRITAMCYRDVEYPSLRHVGTSLVILLADEFAHGSYQAVSGVKLHDEAEQYKISLGYDSEKINADALLLAVATYMRQTLQFVTSMK